MFCSKCGTENNSKNKVCIQCGNKLKSSNRLIIILSIVLSLILIIAFIPIATNYLVNNRIKQQTKQFKDIGIDLEVVSSSGYFITTKKVNFRINNGRYFATYLLYKLGKSSGTNLKLFLDSLKNSNIDWEAFLNGTTFKGKLITNNYLLENPKLNVFLEKLSNEIMFEIQKDKEASKIILPLLDKKILNVSIEFNKIGKLERVKLKDIDETIVEKNDRVVFQLLDNKYTNNLLSMGRIYLSIKNNGKVVVLQLDKIKSFSNNRNYIQIDIGNISFISDEFKFSAQNFTSGSSLNNINSKVSFLSNFSIKNINIDTKKLPISIGKIEYSLNLGDIAKIQFNQLLEDYKNKSGDINSYGKYEIQNIFKFLNKGLALKFDANVENLKVMEIHSGKYSFKINLKINKNDLSLSNIDFNKVIKVIESIDDGENSFVDLKIDDESANIIMNNSKAFKNIFENLGYLKNKEYSFQLWKKDGKIVLNNLNLGIVAGVIGDNHFDNRRFDSAIKFYKFAVENGNLESSFRLAYSYSEIGKYDLAIKYYSDFINGIDPAKSEDNKHIQSLAMNNLANVYMYGKKDYKNAIKWYLKSISNGYKKPNYFGIAYSYDELEDYNNAEKWYLKSIKKDNEKIAMWNLGLIYEYGKGKIPKNINRAFELYLQAARLGLKDAIKKVAYCYRYGYGTKIDIKKANYWEKKQNK